jgi:hypothetical protein
MKSSISPRKTTPEIKTLLKSVNMDFELVVNEALNDYLSKIFHICPFASDLCLGSKQCIGCKNLET